MENIKELFAEWGLWSLVEDISDDGDGTGDNLQLTKEGSEAQRMIDQELDKAREEGRKSAIHEISKTLDTEITRWRSAEDGEFDVLRIGFRYFRSTDVDNYSSSIEAISEEDFEDYESI